MYETLIMSAAISSIFADQLTESGKTEDAQTFREGAGDIFEKLVGAPAAQMKVGNDGRISGLSEWKQIPRGDWREVLVLLRRGQRHSAR